jgi:hypothetical protein
MSKAWYIGVTLSTAGWLCLFTNHSISAIVLQLVAMGILLKEII